MQTRSRLVPAALALAFGVALAAPASAAVPKGTYECPNAGLTFTLKGHHKYEATRGPLSDKGKWTSKGNKIRFKTGPMEPYKGKVRGASGDSPVIVLTFASGGGEFDKCPKV